jgi:murein DD-endopeptidase MepM/ murein hydrolase activator NlpD
LNSAQIDKKGKKKNHRGPSSASAHKAHSSRSNLIGDLLYMYGFWVEYIFVCAYRKVHAVVKGIASTLGNLLMVVLRPVLLGVITFCEDLISPFTRMASGIRHIRELPQELSDAGSDQIRAAKKAYVRSGIRKYYTLLWNAITYVLPAIAAAVLVVVVRNGLGLRFVLNVQVNGESVGYVASEQIFENAREDVQSRINTAKSMLEEAGASVPDTQWEVSPTYSLAVSDDTMTESEIANAILQTASDEIVDGTAVYIDGTLRFVTTEGDHLRTYLESIKAPFENDMDSSIRTGFVHDIRLLDGVYLQESIMSYSDVISALNEGSGVHTYVTEEGDTVQSVVDTTGVTFDSLAQMNPDLQSLDQEIPAGTELLTGASSAELLKVKVVQTETETVAIPFSTEKSESDEYDFGKTVTLQEGVDGLEDVTYEITMIDGEVTDRQAVSYNVLQEPVTQITVTGTKLKNGMVAKLGSGSFVWPVPGYKYVSRWMGNGHRGADICAAYGTPIYASDSGTVIAAGWHYSYGNYVEIDHGNGYKTLYAHMSRILVSQGQAVSKMDQIGEVGSTGNSTGNHCHFEMYYNNVLFSAQTLFGGM